jgi:hypothetical protein
VAFDDEAVAEFFDEQVDQGRRPAQFARIWLHTHPGKCPEPSCTDEDTFARVFGPTDWAVMFILARGGQTYARLEFHVGPGGGLLLPVEVDYTRPFPATDQAAWHEEYVASVREELPPLLIFGESRLEPSLGHVGLRDVSTDELAFWNEPLPEKDDRDVFGPFPDDDEGGFLDDDF